MSTDDPQTKKTYSTVFETIGTEKTLYSKFMAAGLAIEMTRRSRIFTDEHRYDNDIFIIAIDPDSFSSPSNAFVPERDENFNNVSNVLHADTRYNLNLTPARNFLRWANYFNGALLKYPTSSYVFSGGEGNTEMSSSYNCATGLKKDCASTFCDELAENQDIQVSAAVDTVGYLFTPELYEFEHPLSWSEYKTIRDNRHKAIGVSTTDSNHEICFIKRLEYDINKSTAKFTVWKR